MSLRRIDLNLLVVLRVLLAERHITRAADQLNMSQPAVSHALKRLRTLFKDPLLVRTGTEMVLTSRAAAIAGNIQQIFQNVSELLDQGTFVPAKAVGHLRICATEGAILAVMLRGLAEIAALAPSIEIEVSTDMSNLSGRLRSGELDAALTISSENLQQGIRFEPLFSNELLGLTRKTKRRKSGQISRSDYCNATHVQIAGSSNAMIDKYLHDVGVIRRIGLSLPGYVAAAAIVSRTDLIATLPEMLAQHAARIFPVEIRTLPFRLPKITLGLGWHERSEADVCHRWVRERIIERVR